MALEQAQGGSGYVIHSVRYFAGPVPNGGVGAIYYLDVRDPRLSARVVLVSTGGPSQTAVAKVGTTGWKDGDWTGFRGPSLPRPIRRCLGDGLDRSSIRSRPAHRYSHQRLPGASMAHDGSETPNKRRWDGALAGGPSLD